jgi:hypothetical protein
MGLGNCHLPTLLAFRVGPVVIDLNYRQFEFTARVKFVTELFYVYWLSKADG